MKSVPRIVVVGSANVDLAFRTFRLPGPGETVTGRSFHLGMGGKGANQAVVAARLGAQVSFVACVGNDTFGHEAIRCYKNEGIDTTFVEIDEYLHTGAAAIIVDDEAENCIVVVAGANAGVSTEAVNEASIAIQNADALLCQLETPLGATLAAFRIARAAGVRTVLTPAPATELPDELLSLCDFCVPNKSEIELLAGRKVESQDDAESAAKVLRERGVGNVVVTMGSRGAYLIDASGARHIPAVSVEAVDPTGAGDAFTAALAVSLAADLAVRDAARRASVVAALTVARLGAYTAFPSLAEVEQRLGAE